MVAPEKSGQEGGLHPTVVAAGWVSLFTDFSSEMIYPLLPVFLRAVLASGLAFVGLVEGLAESTASLLKLVSGRLSDRWGRRRGLVLGGYGLSAAARPLMSAATASWHVLLLRMADRVGKGIRTSPRDALLADVTPPRERGKAYGFQRAMDHAGAFIGPVAAAALLWFFQRCCAWSLGRSLRTAFALAGLPGLLAVGIIWRYVHDAREPTRRAAGEDATRTAGAARGPLPSEFWKYLVAVSIFTLGNSSDAFLLLRAAEAGVATWQLPLLWAALHAVKMSFSVPGGRWSDAAGRKPVILLGWFIYALAYALFAMVRTSWQAWAVMLFYGLYYACTEGSERALVADLVPAAQRGAAFGAYHAAVGLAALPASVLFGALWQWSGGPRLPFVVGAGLAGVAAAWLSRVRPPSPVAALRRPNSG